MTKTAVITAFILLMLMISGCLDDIEEANLDLAERIDSPAGLNGEVGDGTVTLSWRSIAGAVGYRVYRLSDFTGLRRIAETSETLYIDTDVHNGMRYYYSVSAFGPDGVEGSRSEDIEATPSLYTIRINDGDASTNSREVTLSITAPASTALMIIGNDDLFTGSVWETATAVKSWTVGDGDGSKTVYARFRDESGTESPIVSAVIELDTYAEIENILFNPQEGQPGETVHFTMNVLDNELEGRAEIAIESYDEVIRLYDNGSGGDVVASDGMYGADYSFPEELRGTDLTVTGLFIDRAGNQSNPFEAAQKIGFTDTPEAVTYLAVQDSTHNSITIRWEATEEEHFLFYRIYRDTNPNVPEEPRFMIKQLSNPGQTSYPDQGLDEGVTYYYRIFVVNDVLETAGSPELAAGTYDAIPNPVLLDSLSAIGTDRLTLTWTQNQNTDFRSYYIYRTTSPGVTTASMLVDSISVREVTYYDDSNLDTVTNTYYYRVYVYDRSGKSSRSNEVSSAD